LYGISLRLAPYQQRRPVLQPDVAIPWRQRPRPPWKNEEPENDLPDPRGDLYDARIGKEFRQVPAYVARRRGVRRAQIDQQDPNRAGLPRRRIGAESMGIGWFGQIR